MGWLDQVPRAGALYIGGLFSLRRRDAVKEPGLTHVVSVMRWALDEQLIAPYKHLQIEVDDDEDENLLQYFTTTNTFIRDALDAGGRVFVHCAMGKSRSATVVMAYLMSQYHMSPDEALAQLREARGVCEPNAGFMEQLRLYHEMHTPAQIEADPAYQRWLYHKELAASRSIRQAPDADKIRFEDEHVGANNNDAAAAGDARDASAQQKTLELKCRKCRRTLATSRFLVKHRPKQVHGSPSSPPVPPSACAHYFLEPLSWMKPELERSQLEGRLECPKCSTNVGKYAWQGMQCSCGDWIVPGISLTKTRIDEAGASDPGSMGIRLPPGRALGKESL